MKECALIDADKYCSKCLSLKPKTSFSFDKGSPDGRTYWCKKCAATNSRLNHRKRIAANPKLFKEKKKNNYIKHRHGISLEEYNSKLEEQKNLCGICSKEMVLPHLDHCYTTGKLRAFLCVNCNQGLGSFKDSPGLLKLAALYLEYHL